MVGTAVGHYILETELGRGTYGVVWRAVHRHDPDLRVAIKIVHPALVGDEQFVRSLKEECRRLDKLDHPGIVRFRDLVIDADITAMVLELLEGQDLHDRLAGKPLDVDATVQIADVILDALGYAHARGVVHRDIKPSNVFWSDDGRVKILDFGVARAADGSRASKTGQLVGTLDYMAPERFSGGGSLGMDVYAAGLVIWELLAGRIACPEGDLAGKMGWHLAVGAPRLRTVRQDCPPWLEEAVARLVNRDAAARPADGGAAIAMFRELRAAAPSAQPSLAPTTGRRPPPQTVNASLPPTSSPPKSGLPPNPPRAASSPPVPVSTAPRSNPIPTPPAAKPPSKPPAKPASKPPSKPPAVPPATPAATAKPVATAKPAPPPVRSNPPPAPPTPPPPDEEPEPPPEEEQELTDEAPEDEGPAVVPEPPPVAAPPSSGGMGKILVGVAVLGVGVLGLGAIGVAAVGAYGYFASGTDDPVAPVATAPSSAAAATEWTPLLAGAAYDAATEQKMLAFVGKYGAMTPPPAEVALATAWLDQYDAWGLLSVPIAVEREGDAGGTVERIALSPNGDVVVVAGPAKYLARMKVDDASFAGLVAIDGTPTAIAWKPDATGVAVAVGPIVGLWNVTGAAVMDAGKAVGTMAPAPLAVHPKPAGGLAFGADGSLYSAATEVIATSPAGATKFTWAMPDGDADVRVVALPDGKVAAIGTKGVLRVWKADTGERIGDTVIGVAPTVATFIAPDVILGTTGKLLAVDPSSGGVAWSWTTEGAVSAVAIGPRGWIAVGTDRGAVVILDGTTHAEIGRWLAPGGLPVDLVAVGDRLAVVTGDAKVRILGPDPVKLAAFPAATTIGAPPAPAPTVEAVEAVVAAVPATPEKPKIKAGFENLVGTYDLYVDRVNDQCGLPGTSFSYDTVRIDGTGNASASGYGGKRTFKAKVDGPVVSWTNTRDFPDGGCTGGKERTSWRLLKIPGSTGLGGTVADSIDVLVGGGACVACDIITTVRLVPR